MTLSRATMAAIRFGFGLSQGETPPKDADALLQQLQDAQLHDLLFPLEGIEIRRQRISDYYDIRKILSEQAKSGEPIGQRDKVLNRDLYNRFTADVSARITQAAVSPYGFHERLAHFWVNHFTVSADKSTDMKLLVPLYEAEAIRPHLSGDFATLLKQASFHPAMLIFLDQSQSMGPNSKAGLKRKDGGVNENFGREVMELHTLGVNTGYSQKDVHQLSLLLTGLVYDRMAVAAGYDRNKAEPGFFTVLGHSYTRDPEPLKNASDVLDMLARDPRTMTHISTQLYMHFIDEAPNKPVIDSMVAAWKASDGELTAVYRAMLDSPDAWEQPGQKFKMPFDYVVSSLRASGLSKDQILGEDGKDFGPIVMPSADEDLAAATSAKATMATGQMMAQEMNNKAMGQGAAAAPAMMATMLPPKPAPHKRPPLARQAANVIASLGEPVWRPSDAAGFKDNSAHWFSASQLTQRIQWARQLANQMPNTTDPRNFVEVALADYARDDTIQVARQAPSRQAGLVMTLVSPEFNRR
ncbi:DUF1800 domain-containing protein [Allorhizobium sp. BGMRC 0089]|uniref:DUF1800 domain-containing protein n=1 Tax=Allorhizobium sonneratiae TaxID=2934936 RepID=UPI002033A04F|nr:DUF1800 domain-containing protein [Allorhizobium sonneratiae]MCM2293003.1 DUF1800 domain-containing protein [Allorhizobium sonneratiae]